MLAGGDDLIRAMRPAFDEAVAAVAASVEQFGPSPNDTAVLAAGPAAVAAWEARTEAIRRLADVHADRNALAAAGYGERDPQVIWYLASAATAGDIERAGIAFGDKVAGLIAARVEGAAQHRRRGRHARRSGAGSDRAGPRGRA